MSTEILSEQSWPKRLKALEALIRKYKITNYRIAKVSGMNISTVGRILNRDSKTSRYSTISDFTKAVIAVASRNGYKPKTNGGSKCLK